MHILNWEQYLARLPGFEAAWLWKKLPAQCTKDSASLLVLHLRNVATFTEYKTPASDCQRHDSSSIQQIDPPSASLHRIHTSTLAGQVDHLKTLIPPLSYSSRQK